MKAYYAHCVALYNTKQEERDLETIRILGFDVFNPNNDEVQKEVDRLKELGQDYDYMGYFEELVDGCDLVIFRALPIGGLLPSGVAREVLHAQANNMPVIELPWSLQLRLMDKVQTREYVREVGTR